MSESKQSDLLKGGHAPAEKIAGGVRITRKTRLTSESEKNQKKLEGHISQDYGEEIEEQSKNVIAQGGLAGKTNKDYPKEAIRAYHDKQVPQLHKPTKPNVTLFQPTKQ